ncbi:butyrophilin subfamily 2 member A1-like [Narcine bancroftii]|uniref:butyrophilin subfamily 2 member A1-like n=1 Tax=Narcine bancroftii TaxID=1343680 RepID=UPI0038321F53
MSTVFHVLRSFLVVTPRRPVVARVGSDVVLDCQLIPEKSLEEMEVRWFQTDWSYIVHLYRKGQEWPEAQDERYQGRTKMFKEALTNGNVSLLLMHVTVKDDGKYKCFVVSKTQKNESLLQLNVASVGQEPVIKIKNHQNNGIELSCFSKRWFPRPQVEWRDSAGQAFEGHEEKVVEDTAGFLTVESTITVQAGTPSQYSCHIYNHLVGQEQAGILEVADVFFPQTSRWMVAFWCMFSFLLVSVLVIIIICCRSRKLQQKIKEYANVYHTLALEQTQCKQEKEDLLQRMEQERFAAKSEYDKLLHSIEWDKMVRHSVTVHLDPETANGNLKVSDDQTGVCAPGSFHNVTNSPARFDRYPFILGTDFFEKGKHYWEVSVEGSTNWDLGVVRESVNRKGKVILCPEQGFWCFGRFWDIYEAKDKANIVVNLQKKPTHVGVYLNLDEGYVSFHDTDTKQKLFVFQANFQERIHPFFCPWRSSDPLQIIPVNVGD